MTFLISHRGNINGPETGRENNPSQIKTAQSLGFHVEVDVWNVDNQWYSGHSEPQYKIDKQLLEQEDLWIHAKNLGAVEKLQFTNSNWFWHQNDDITLTRKGNIWCFPGKEVEGGIMMDHGQVTDVKVMGICTDNPIGWSNKLKRSLV